MKKITLLLFLSLFSVLSEAQTTLTHSNDPTTIDTGVTCSNSESNGINAYRSFVLEDFNISADFNVESVQFGANELLNLNGDYPVTLILSTTDAPFPTGTLTEVASTTVNLTTGDEQVLKTVPLIAAIPAGSELVFSVQFPDDGTTIPAIGTNNNGQSAVSWFNGTCLSEITDLEDFNISNSWVMNVIGNEEVLGTAEHLLAEISISPNPASDFIRISEPATLTILETRLYNISGQDTGLYLENGQLNLSSLSQGVYFLKLITSKGLATRKILKR